MTTAVRWGPLAWDDLARIIRYITEENPIAARQLARELLIAADSLALFPRRGRVGRVTGTRELVVCRPYLLIYEIDADNGVEILRVWHGAQGRAE